MAPLASGGATAKGEPATGIRTGQISLGSAAFVVINAAVLAIVIAFPEMVLHEALAPVTDPATVDSLIDTALEPTIDRPAPDNLNDLFR